MNYWICKHNKIRIEKLPFQCEECIREAERNKVADMLQVYSVKAPEKSRAATFTPEQFMKALSYPNPPVKIK